MSSHTAFRRGRALALLALLVSAAGPTWAACNGNPNAKFDPTNGQTVPERTGGVFTTVTLDGSKSTPGNNDLLFQWTYTGSSPSGLTVTLNNPTAQKPTFVAPNVGPAGATLNFSLTVTCGTRTDTQTTTVNVTDVFVNAPPVASAFISPLDANEGQTVTLDGSASSDPDGQPITYAWTQISGSPTVSLANVSANGAVKSFVAPNLPVTTTLGFRLTVSDGTLTGTTDKTVNIVFNNDPPIAALNCPVGGVLTVDEGASVNFSSAGSSDPEGGALTYAWSQGLGLPNLNIGGTTTPALSFTAPHLGYQQLGGTSITLTVTDALNASASKTCGLFITDVTPPVIVVPNDITAEATSAAGASVSYSVTSQDAVEDQLPAPLACVPPSSSVFPLDANTTVACTDHDANGNTANASFKIKVQDTTPPILTVPGDTAVEATSAAGAVGNFTATKTDLVDGTSAAACTPASGSQFALGDTTVACSAADAHGNAAANQSFVLSVMDTTAPTIDPHDDLADVEATSAAGAVVLYTAPATHDAVDGDGVADCTPPSGDTFPLGHTDIACGKTDTHDNAATPVSFGVNVVDTTAPVIAGHADIEDVEATSGAGAVVTYAAPTWTDAVDGTGSASCLPASGETFALGTTTVHCNTTDAAGNAADETTFTVEVVDTTPPVIEPHDDINGVEATGPSGAAVTYASPATHDVVDGDGVASCMPVSGSTFGLGPNIVTCTAEDAHHNPALPTTFVIEVVDTTPPAIDPVSDILGVEATGPGGATVTFTSPGWTDAVSGTGTATCSPASGSTFALDTTTVTCGATDGAGNHASRSFSVQVVDTTAPTLSLPSDITKEATGPAGAAASFSPSASDIVSGNVAVTCAPSSGSTFGLGTTTVACHATDGAGNTANGSFTVTVVDTTMPVLTLPANITAEATGPTGAPIIFSASANDLVSGSVGVSCTPASGSTFAITATTVNCSATDGAGNTATGSFTVTVRDTTPPVIAAHADVAALAAANSNATVTYTSPTAQDIVDGAVTVNCTPASGSVFGMGSTAVTCKAKDARNNESTSTFHVNVSYNFGGFLRPIDNLPTVNVVKAGQAIPVKFSLGGNQGLAIFASGYPKVVVMGCTGTLLDVVEETVTAGNSSLQYDAGAGQYIYVWKTDKAWAATCRQLVVKFVDGSTQVANFNFTR